MVEGESLGSSNIAVQLLKENTNELTGKNTADVMRPIERTDSFWEALRMRTERGAVRVANFLFPACMKQWRQDATPLQFGIKGVIPDMLSWAAVGAATVGGGPLLGGGVKLGYNEAVSATHAVGKVVREPAK
jgi:hypothetical protein